MTLDLAFFPLSILFFTQIHFTEYVSMLLRAKLLKICTINITHYYVPSLDLGDVNIFHIHYIIQVMQEIVPTHFEKTF